MEDWNLQHFGDVGRVDTRSTFFRFGGKADLIVDDDMQSATGGVASKLAEVQRLLNDPFTGERRISVDENSHRLGTLEITAPVLFGSTSSQGDRIDELKVARVKAERYVDFGTGARRPIAAVSHVIADVPTTAREFRLGIVERPEDTLGSLLHDIGQNVQAASVRHRQDHTADPMIASFFQGAIEQRNQALGPFERKRFGSDELLADELFEDRCVG